MNPERAERVVFDINSQLTEKGLKPLGVGEQAIVELLVKHRSLSVEDLKQRNLYESTSLEALLRLEVVSCFKDRYSLKYSSGVSKSDIDKLIDSLSEDLKSQLTEKKKQIFVLIANSKDKGVDIGLLKSNTGRSRGAVSRDLSFLTKKGLIRKIVYKQTESPFNTVEHYRLVDRLLYSFTRTAEQAVVDYNLIDSVAKTDNTLKFDDVDRVIVRFFLRRKSTWLLVE